MRWWRDDRKKSFRRYGVLLAKVRGKIGDDHCGFRSFTAAVDCPVVLKHGFDLDHPGDFVERDAVNGRIVPCGEIVGRQVGDDKDEKRLVLGGCVNALW